MAWLLLDERLNRGDGSLGWTSARGVCQASRAFSLVWSEVVGVEGFSVREDTLEYCTSKRRVSRWISGFSGMLRADRPGNAGTIPWPLRLEKPRDILVPQLMFRAREKKKKMSDMNNQNKKSVVSHV